MTGRTARSDEELRKLATVIATREDSNWGPEFAREILRLLDEKKASEVPEPEPHLEGFAYELERAARIFTARDLERACLRTREGGGQLMSPEVAEARRALRAAAVRFARSTTEG